MAITNHRDYCVSTKMNVKIIAEEFQTTPAKIEYIIYLTHVSGPILRNEMRF